MRTPFIASTTGYVSNLRYPGQYYDTETGTNYNYFRNYEPATGRYLQSDPIGLAGGMSTYAYVGNNPLTYTDSYGLFLWPWESPVMIYGGTPAEQAQVMTAVNQVFSTPRGQEMLTKINGPWYEHGNPQTLNINNYAVDAAKSDSNVFSINPDNNIWVKGEHGMFKLSLAPIIAHEMGHSLMGALDDGPCHMNNTVQNENPVEKSLGLPIRTSYDR